MSNYTPTFNGAAKDAAHSVGSAAELDTEFALIQTMSTTKADKATPAATNNIATLSASGNLQDGGKLLPTGDIVGLSDTQTLTNKTLTSPIITGTTFPSFFAYKSGDQNVATTSVTKITFNNEEFDVGNDLSSSVYTPLVAGKYYLHASARIENFTADEQINIHIYRNGLLVRSSLIHSPGTVVNPQVSCVIAADGVDDYFEVFIDSTSDASFDVMGSLITCFCGHWVGP